MTLELDPDVAPGPAVSSRRRRPRATSGIALGPLSGTTLGVVTLWLSLLVLLPLAAVVGKGVDGGWSVFWSAVSDAEAASAIRLTVGLAVGVALVNGILGTLVAWVLVRDRFRGSWAMELVIDIPFALPTIVAGVVMFAMYAGADPLGPDLFSTRTVLFIALLFVTLPFTVRTVQPVLIELDRDVEQAAASLGASGPVVFRRIVMPQLIPAIASGAALSFARALGEYGSLVLISGNLPYKTEIASSLIYAKLQNSDSPLTATRQASAIAVVLLLSSAIVLVLLNLLQRRVARRG